MTNNCILQVEDEEADIFLLKHVFEEPFDLAHTLEVAHLLKGWWLGYNRFAPVHEKEVSDLEPRTGSEAQAG